MTKNTNHLSATDRAAIQLQREEHEFKLDFRDILKALFMWKEKPTERVRNKQSSNPARWALNQGSR